MIILTKLSGKQFMLNEDYIETVQETPDTVIVMENGHSYIVRESVEEIMRNIVDFRRLGKRRRNSQDNENAGKQ